MYLAEFQVYNYKSFLDSGAIKLKPGFNVLTGQNNAGKTALLEALGLSFSNKPHRSLGAEPSPSSSLGARSHVLFRVAITQEEFATRLQKVRNSKQEALISLRKSEFPHSGIERLWDSVLECKEVLFDFTCVSHQQQQNPLRSATGYLSRGGQVEYHLLSIRATDDGDELWLLEGLDKEKKQQPSNGLVEIGSDVGGLLRSSIYGFRAERMNIGLSNFGSQKELHSDASNLPEVLHVLQSTNPARFQRYNKLVKRVFPQVEWITVRPVGNTQVEILVWPVGPETERADLAVPLSESGTGISQVLAMLYVLVTSETPRTLLIDEPNSFLHPGAVRALMEILREHPQHQYILSTHSPELIAASNPSTIHILRRTQGATQVESVDTQQARHFRTLLMEVGSRPSDVFGAENVLWVEGPTEQLCFPLIARHFVRRPLAGVSIVGVLHTGDFDAKKNTDSVFRIYERLTQGSALLPPAIAFIFDREIRPEKDRQDLERRSKGMVHFLDRRTYENYLLHAGAIAAILNAHPPFTEAPIDPGKIQDWMTAHIQDVKYYGKAKTQNYPQDIDAPRLLDDLFLELSENRLTYNKVEHSLELTEWLLAHAPEELKEIGDLLAEVLPASSQAGTPVRS